MLMELEVDVSSCEATDKYGQKISNSAALENVSVGQFLSCVTFVENQVCYTAQIIESATLFLECYI